MVKYSSKNHVIFLYFIYLYVSKAFLKNLNFILFFSLLQINIFLVFLDHFNALISKIIFKN
jgi:hypothetical protein